MTESAQSHGASLRVLHRVVLALLALGAVYVFTSTGVGGETPPPQRFTLIALGLAVASIVARRLSTSPVIQPSVRTFWAAASLGLALGIGVTATVLVHLESERENALFFLLGAGLLCLRPPASIAARRASRTSLPKAP